MRFLKICGKMVKFVLKSFAIFIVGLITTFTLIFGGLMIHSMIVYHNYYAKTLQVEIPKRDADFSEDTHGGFMGEGDTVKIYELTDKEIEKLNEDIKTSGVWKPIDDELYSNIPYLNGKYCGGKVPQLESCWYCFYDKYRKTYAFPSEPPYYVPNYIIGQYSEEEGKLWIYELDT